MSFRRKAGEVKSGPLQLALMPLEARVLEVLRRAPRRMPATLREESVKLFAPGPLASAAQVLTSWAAAHHDRRWLHDRGDDAGRWAHHVQRSRDGSGREA